MLRHALLVTVLAYAPLLGASLLAVFGIVHDFTWQLWYLGALVLVLPVAWIWLEARVPANSVLPVTVLMLVIACPLVLWCSHQLRLTGCRLAAARLQPLAQAIERCLSATGQLPTDLKGLVPRYLEALPQRVPQPRLFTPGPGQAWMLVASFFDGLCDGYDVIYLSAGIDPHHRHCEVIDGNWVLSRF